jgi:hypothetical protein
MRAVQDERARCAFVIKTQIQILQERIKQTQSDNMKQVWAIAIIELRETQLIIEKPMGDAA